MSKKMENGGIRVTVEDSHVDFMLRAGYVISTDQTLDTPVKRVHEIDAIGEYTLPEPTYAELEMERMQEIEAAKNKKARGKTSKVVSVEPTAEEIAAEEIAAEEIAAENTTNAKRIAAAKRAAAKKAVTYG